MPLFFVHTPELIRIVMTASSSITSRILSLAVLLLSLAPLASIYILVCTLNVTTVVVLDPTSSSSPAAGAANSAAAAGPETLAAVLRDPHATVGDVWAALFWEQWQQYQYLQTGGVGMNGAASTTTTATMTSSVIPIREVTARQLSIVLPWVISIFLGIIVPACLSIASFVWANHQQTFQQQQQQQQQQWMAAGRNGGDSRHSRARRKRRLKQRLQCFTKILQPSDMEPITSTTNSTTTTTTATMSTKANETTAITTTTTTTAKSIDDDYYYYSDASGHSTVQWKLPRPGMALPIAVVVVQDDEDEDDDDEASLDSEPEIDGPPHNRSNPKRHQKKKDLHHKTGSWNTHVRPKLPDSHYRIVAEECAICLHSYQCQDAVTWSPNPDCIHCFHQDCILPWLARKTTAQQQLCPVCRQSFAVRSSPSPTLSSLSSSSLTS